MKVGNIEIVPVLDGHADLPLEFAVTSPRGSTWDCGHQPTDELGRLDMGLGSFLVRTGERVVLVDLGVGPVSIHEAFHSGGLLDSLRDLGLTPDDVTDVLLTHLHIDHVGWASVEGTPTFARATYHLHADDWDHFMTGPVLDPQLDPLMRSVVSPVEDHVSTFDDEVELLPGIVARPAPGHTPGSTVFVVRDGGERALLLGDVTHTVAELTDPEWEGVLDVDREAANAVRRRLAEELESTGDAFAPAHFPGLSFGRLVTSAGLRQFEWA